MQRANRLREAPRVEQAITAMTDGAADPVCAYLYDLPALRAHATSLVDSLPERCQLFYAIKANSQEPILAALAGIVDGFEVASLGEVTKARSLCRDIPLVLGGPAKTDAELEGAIRQGVRLIHLESAHELLRLEQAAKRLNTVQPALLRANLAGPLPGATLSMAGRPTQFGIDQAQIPAVLALAHDCPHVQIVGYHFHSLSNNLDPQAHAQLIGRYLEQARRWNHHQDTRLEIVNVGGGIGINYANVTQQFDWATFITHLNEVLDRSCPPRCTVVFECGRYITAACGSYATQVIDLKHTHGTHYAIVRGGTHHFRLPASWRHSHPFSYISIRRWPYPFDRPEIRDCPVTVAGQLCSPKDILAHNVFIDHLRIGDVLVFHYAGAYGWSISHHDFLTHPHPQHLYLDCSNGSTPLASSR
jgi:diaminopimelate decarboxylase